MRLAGRDSPLGISRTEREGIVVNGKRPGLRTALTVLAATAATAALGLTLASHGSGGSRDNQVDPELVGVVFNGSGSQDGRVVLDAVGDHFHYGACAEKDPVSLAQSWSASLVAVPAPLLGGGAECGKQVDVSTAGGATVVAVVVGTCSGCSGDDIALSPALFRNLASWSQLDGSVPVSWKYLP
jgi:hypothetical protein